MSSGGPQMSFSEMKQPRSRDPAARWLGLVTDHRRLFDSLQDGWLHPLPSRTGVLVGIGAYAREQNTTQTDHLIQVCIRLDMQKLPDLEVEVFRGKKWVRSCLKKLESSDEALFWPGMLPTFAISDLLVSTDEERARLIGLTQATSNVMLPVAEVSVGSKSEKYLEPAVPPEPDVNETTAKLVVPSDEDTIHGAMSMAVWAVPRIEPWLRVLVESLSSERTRLPELAAVVNAEWWRFPPWARMPDDVQPSDLQDSLWLGAVDIFRSRPTKDRFNPRELAEKIAIAAKRVATEDSHSHEIEEWLRTTHSILRAESSIQLDNWQDSPVGKAIQLVLTRPEPTAFKTWFKDRGLAPAVTWSAATLCGLLRGYKRLDAQFRGKSLQRELLSVHALRVCAAAQTRDIHWPSLVAEAPQWRRDSSHFILSWDGKDFAEKPLKERGRWYAADLSDEGILRKAQAVANDLGWSCTRREVILEDVKLRFSGPGTMKVRKRPERQLVVSGKHRIQLPPGVPVEERLDTEEFRRLIAVEAIELGRLPNPPTLQAGDVPVEQPIIPGLGYISDFLTKDEEKDLIEKIDQSDWIEDLQRRVQHYGWRYDYKARQVDGSMRIGELPDWAEKYARKLIDNRLVRKLPDQVIVNEYKAGQGISKHVDSEESFEDGIATISLLESWEMEFQEKSSKRKVSKLLERRSVAVMSGDARYCWTHEIKKRKRDPNPNPGGPRIPRKRRISLTFRKVKPPKSS